MAHQLNELPLPEENIAWEDMEKRLEEDNDDTGLIWWRPGCILGGVLLLVLLASGWWLVRPEKWFSNKKEIRQSARQEQADSFNKKPVDSSSVVLSKTNDTNQRKQNLARQPAPTKTENPAIAKSIPAGAITSEEKVASLKTRAGSKPGNTEKPSTIKVSTTAVNLNKRYKPNRKTNIDNRTKHVELKTNIEKDQKIKTAVLEKSNHVSTRDSMRADSSKQITTPVTAVVITGQDSLKKKTQAVDTAAANTKTKKDKNNIFFFSAGLAVQQLIPIAGQKATPYNSLGRKGTLLDYIPSVYVRLNRTNKWFIQAEFKYGAPQYTKELIYSQNIVTDSLGVHSTITSQKLKKTFYHQLPLTFNYHVLSNWSIGGGVVWNKFMSAISEEEIIERNNQTQTDSVISKGVISTIKNLDSAASVFSKSYFQAVFETQYEWKRFSLGARYAFGLEPYINFPIGGVLQHEKNSSLQIFIRYQLWRSKRR